jgi:hypothetical protein
MDARCFSLARGESVSLAVPYKEGLCHWLCPTGPSVTLILFLCSEGHEIDRHLFESVNFLQVPRSQDAVLRTSKVICTRCSILSYCNSSNKRSRKGFWGEYHQSLLSFIHSFCFLSLISTRDVLAKKGFHSCLGWGWYQCWGNWVAR